jgi:HEAT repeat protein
MSFLAPLTPTLEAALRDATEARPEARVRAARRLADAPAALEDRARGTLLALLDDPVGPVRAAALESLGRLGGSGSRGRVASAFDDPDATVRQQAVIAAARLGEEALLRRALRDPRPEMRFQAVSNYGAVCPEDLVAAVAPLVDDPDPEVRAVTAEALGESADAQARGPLGRALADSHPAVRWAAALSLADLGDRRAVAELRPALLDPKRAEDAAAALGRLGADEARQELRSLARRWWGPPRIRVAAGTALARLGDPLGPRVLQAMTRAWRREARELAARSLQELAG